MAGVVDGVTFIVQLHGVSAAATDNLIQVINNQGYLQIGYSTVQVVASLVPGPQGVVANALALGMTGVVITENKVTTLGDMISIGGSLAGMLAPLAVAAGLPIAASTLTVTAATLAVGGLIYTISGLIPARGATPQAVSNRVGTLPDPQVKIIRYVDPLALDLDGDGLEITPLSTQVMFDANGDGIRTGTAWIGSDDGILVWDRNQNGSIDSGSELFGDESILGSGTNAIDGFSALRDLDQGNVSNGAIVGRGDGIFDSQDAQFSSLRIWRDLNQDGVSQSSELNSLSDAGIESISLNNDSVSTPYNDAILVGSASFQRSNGSQGQVGDFILAQNSFERTFPVMAVNQGAELLPAVAGTGQVRDLREAATANPTLVNLAAAVQDSTSYTQYRQAIEDLLLEWGNSSSYTSAGNQAKANGFGLILSDPVNDQERGWMDAAIRWNAEQRAAFRLQLSAEERGLFDSMRERMVGGLERLSAYEAFTGHSFISWQQIYQDATNYQPRVSSTGIVRVELTVPFTQVIFETRNAVMSSESGYIRLTIPVPASGEAHVDSLWSRIVDDAASNLMGSFYLKKYLDLVDIDLSASATGLNFTRLNQSLFALSQSSPTDGAIALLGLYKDYGVVFAPAGWDGAEQVHALAQRASNEAPIRDAFAVLGINILQPGAVAGTESDDVYSRLAYVNGWFRAGGGQDLLLGSTDGDLFDGGSGDDVIRGNEGNDDIQGGDGQDVIDGGSGSDTLIGGMGSDVYIFGGNVGSDVIRQLGVGSLDYYADQSHSDVIRFTTTNSSDVQVSFGANNIVNLTKISTGERVSVEYFGWLSNGEYSPTVRSIEFADGVVWAQSTIEAMLRASSTSGNDYLFGIGNAAVQIDGGYGDDYIQSRRGDDTLIGGGGNDYLGGAAGNGSLSGGDGQDVLNGEDGEDTIDGGNGDDNLSGGAGADILIGGEGADQLGGGDGEDTLLGGEGVDYLYGSYGDDKLEGGASTDLLFGGVGSDIYVFGRDFSGADVIEDFNNGFGNDVLDFSSFQLYEIKFERVGSSLRLTSQLNSATVTVSGYFSDTTSFTGIRFANGRVLAQTDVVAVLSNQAPQMSDQLSQTTISVGAPLQYTLSDFFYDPDSTEPLSYSVSVGPNGQLPSWLHFDPVTQTLSGTPDVAQTVGLDIRVTDNLGGMREAYFIVRVIGDLVLTGGSGADFLIGDSGNDKLYGMAGNDMLDATDGNDLLDGGGGSDTMYGGAGDDFYVVDSISDLTLENPDEGRDTVGSSVAWVLGENIEDLNLTGSGVINGTGNSIDNVIVGNGAANVLDGAAGADSLSGGGGNDTYFIDNNGDVVTEQIGGGTDTVNSSISVVLGVNLENLTLTGTTSINGTGNDVANILIGNSAANVLDGSAGGDTMVGGAGNDTFIVDNVGDVTTEVAGAGTDSVQSSIGWSLSSNLENLTLTGSGAINGVGNTLANMITGNSAANVLDGGAGADTLIGGAGNDGYIVDNSADVVTELAGEGTDQVNASVSFALGGNLENLVLTGTAAINGTGNTLDNLLTGNSAVNTLTGAAGNDTLDGLAGADILVGGAGDDTYVTDIATDTITELANEGTDTVKTSLGWTLAANIENLVLTGSAAVNGTGNASANVLTGNVAANVLDGGAGSDTLIGGSGNDTYVVDNASDSVIELTNEGTDIVNASVTTTLSANVENLTLTGTAATNGTGNALGNILNGNSAANVLDGGAGSDTLVGGAGNDTYVVDNAADVVTEAASAGTDLVQSSINWTLGANLENLTLTGTGNLNGNGNTLANAITGNAAANVLDGGAGADTLVGGGGNDSYVVDNTADIVTELAGEGVDQVSASVTTTLSANVENLTLSGTAAIKGTGNALDNLLTGNSAANTLTGGAGNDTLDGLGGVDILIGGTGNDVFVVDVTTDTVTENLNEGTDTVTSAVTWTLGNNLENLTLTGTAATNGTGNALDNVLVGNGAANTLIGAAGNDSYRGGLGADVYTDSSTTSNDVYAWGRGEGADMLTDSGGTDRLDVLAGVSSDQVWLRRVSNNLEVSVIGTSDRLTITNWYASTSNQLESLRLADGRALSAANVQKLVDAMAAFAPPAVGQTSLPANYQTTLNPVIAANWM